MRRRKSLTALWAVILIGFAAYAGFWWFAAGRIKEAVAGLPEMARAQGVDAAWQSVRVGGFPLAFRIELAGVTIRGSGTTPGAELRTPSLRASARPWALRAWQLAAPDGISATFGPGDAPLAKLSAASATGAVAVAANGGAAIWLTLDEAKAAANGSDFAARAVDAWVILPPDAPVVHNEAGIGIAADLREVAVPAVPRGFANAIDDIGFAMTLMGTLSAAPPRQAATAWRDSGGTLELDQFQLRWGELGITGSGTLALDTGLQPIGGFSGAIAGYDQLMAALVAAGRVKPGDARLARLALAILAKAGPDGRPEISTSFRIQDGEMYLGPAKLGRMPRIDW